jgi:hypothetical protein
MNSDAYPINKMFDRLITAVIIVVLVLLFFAGCSLVEIRSSSCAQIKPTNGLYIAECGEYAATYRDDWLNDLPLLVSDMDTALTDMQLPLLSEVLDGTLIRLHDLPEGQKTWGEYSGYHEPETHSIDLWLSENAHTPRVSSMAHEFMHLYDHLHLGVYSLAEWTYMNDNGYHFRVPIIANYVIRRGLGIPPEDTDLGNLFCGGAQ